MPVAVLVAMLICPAAQVEQSFPLQVAERLRAMGMTIKLLPTADSPVIEARFEGGMFYIATGCGGAQACLTFYASFHPARTVPAEAVRAWAAAHPEVTAEIDKAGHPAIEQTLRLQGGLRGEALDAAVRDWLTSVAAFREFAFAAR